MWSKTLSSVQIVKSSVLGRNMWNKKLFLKNHKALIYLQTCKACDSPSRLSCFRIRPIWCFKNIASRNLHLAVEQDQVWKITPRTSISGSVSSENFGSNLLQKNRWQHCNRTSYRWSVPGHLIMWQRGGKSYTQGAIYKKFKNVTFRSGL